MNSLLIVALGGAIGSVSRYLLSGWAVQYAPEWRFPVGTFVVNVIGCFIVGILSGLVVRHSLFSADVRLFLFTGLIGGFTTFSAFGLETFHLLRQNEVLIAGSYVASSVIVGLFILWLGFALVSVRL